MRDSIDLMTAVMNVMMDANLALQIARAKREPRDVGGTSGAGDTSDTSGAAAGGGAPSARRARSGELFAMAPEILTISSGGA